MARPFRFVEVEDPGVFSTTANGEDWVHRGSRTRLLPGFRSRTVCTNRRLDPAERQNIFCEILEHSVTHRPVFRIRSEDQKSIEMTSSSATKAVADFTAKLLGAPLRKKSGPEFFGYSRLEVQRLLTLALQNRQGMRDAEEHPNGLRCNLLG